MTNARFVFSSPAHCLAFGFGAGLSKKAPGTVGTIAALPCWLVFIHLLAFPGLVLLIALAFLLGVFVCGKTSDALGVHDHGGIVWDEFVGLWLTLLFLPATWSGLLVGFLFFRLFDILKPWPIRWLDKKIHGGLGIMLDDVVAAVPAVICSMLLLQFI